MPALTVAEIAQACGGKAEGDTDRAITGANSLEAAGSSDLSFVANAKAYAAARHSLAGCLITDLSFREPGPWATVRVAEPRRAFAQVLAKLYPRAEHNGSIHPTAVIAVNAHIGANCHIGPYSVIGEHASIGAGSFIDAAVRIGEAVEIGADATIYSHVTIYHRVKIGARVILHAGCVIGADGFGFAMAGDHYEKFPQVGTVQIEDDVEIGANCTIDRAALGVTRIGSGSKLDNLVHIAHNCTIGEHVVIAAQTGFAGGVTIGDYAVIGGQVGMGEKASVAARAVIGSGAGILSFQKVEAGEPVWGTPARPLRQHLKGLANTGKIPALKETIRDLTRRLEELEKTKA